LESKELLSVWRGTAATTPPLPSLTGKLNADTVVIGGGIAGVTTAMLLALAGQKVILLEARSIGGGTTGNSTGNLYSVVDEHLSSIRKKWNDDVMKAVVESRSAAIDLIEKNTTQYKIECEFHRFNFNYYAEKLDDKIEKFIEEEYKACYDAGVNPSIVDKLPLPFETIKGLTAPNQAQFNPFKYVQGLVHNMPANCTIFEHSPVIDFDEKEGTVKTPSGEVKADHIIMATHTPKGFAPVQLWLTPIREFGIAAELKEDVLPGGIFWRLGDEKRSIRSYKENGKTYALCIGEKFKTGQNQHTEESIRKLEEYLTSHFPIANISHRWGGQAYRSADMLPYIGKYHHKLYLMTGFATDGLVYGTLSAMIISDKILERENKWADIYKADRFTPLKSAKDAMVDGLDNLKQWMKDFPGVNDHMKAEEIEAGDGKIIEKDGEKIAVCKTNDGVIKTVSAVCTHMKCIVNWNHAEQTWDCPCHGSRFDTDGKIIEGPALTDLETKTI
jgi:glycine/D-amino acid oxidase-like deaminating enzyme/nitrite reductase/ring-hydroxylating ferredoxin subunit